ncbi:DUF6142 family protein [Lachnospira multipara]|jgi:hypothetical protein|uniref:DUF6142 family protein n=1 Tax=Lachnospira multipara TaxID=28051 RepID=UPI000485D1E9|nr:DUF6142 family protein [Lachnospira multipara]
MKIFNKYKFSNKNQTLGGTISTALGILSLASLSYGIYISTLADGNAGLKVGSLALLSLVLSSMGTAIGLLSFRESDKFYTLSKVGSMLCGILTVFMLAILLMGV